MISLKYGIVTNYLVLYENKLVLKTWLNETYGKDTKFKKIDEMKMVKRAGQQFMW